MALRIDATGERATCPSPWNGGPITFSVWVRRTSTTSQIISALINNTNGPTGVPRITFSTASSSTMTCTYAGDSGTTNNGTTDTYPGSTWFHVAVVFKGTGSNVLTQCAVAINGVLDTFSSASARDLALSSVIDTLIIGSSSANSNIELAHYAVFNGELTPTQVTELQTKLPTAITGITPVVYCPFLANALNQGSGGSTYDMTLTGATIDSTNDGSLPSLSSGGGTTTTVSVTNAKATATVTGETPVVGTINVTNAKATAVVTGETPVFAEVSVTNAKATATVTGTGSSGGIRLRPSVKVEQGNPDASRTGVRWAVFEDYDLTSMVDSGTALVFDAQGRPTIDIIGSSFVVGDWVPLLLTHFDHTLNPWDRTVRTFFGFAQAENIT